MAYSAIGMLTFLLIAGLAIDISRLYLVGAELQNAADAAALSAASALNSGASGIREAVDRAVAPMNGYDFNKLNVTIAREDVRFAVNLSAFDGGGVGLSEAEAMANPANIRFVRVVITPKDVQVLFARVALGTDLVSLTRSAVAGQSVPLNILCSLVPLAVTQDDVTAAPLNINGSCPNQAVFTPGCTYTIRMPPGKTVSAGNYHILALSGRGGADVREGVALGSENCYRIGDLVDTKPGVTAGPVRQGMNTRFDEYTGALDPDEYPPDTNIKTGITYAQYASGLSIHRQAPSNPGVANRRLLLLPIVNLSEFGKGRDEVRIARFGVFFMQDKVANGNGGELRAEFVSNRVSFGDGGYDPGAGAPLLQATVPVLYR